MDYFEARIRSIATLRPSLMLAEAIAEIDTPGRHLIGDSAPLETRAKFVFESPDLMALIEDRMINAIKETRARTSMGLKQAKDACELARQWQRDGRIPENEREQVEKEALEAVASIERTIRERDTNA